MRVLFLHHSAQLGGAERSLVDCLWSLQALAEVELHVVLGEDGPLIDEIRKLDIPVVAVPLPQSLRNLGDSELRGAGLRSKISFAFRGMLAGTAFRKYTAGLRNACKRTHPDILHSNGLKMHLLTRSVAPIGCKVVWHIRDFLSHRRLARQLVRWPARSVARAVAISKSVQDDLHSILPSVPSCVVYNAVDIDKFSPGRVDTDWLDQASGLVSGGRNVVRVGLVATYAAWKGHHLFIDAAARMIERLGDAVRFYVVGGPIYATSGSQVSEDELRSQLTVLGITQKVGLIPFQKNVARVFRSLDVVVHASVRPEPFGRTIAEAMACGKAVVVPDSGGPIELVESGKDGIVYPAGNVQELAAAVTSLVVHPQLRDSLGIQARNTAAERFDRGRLGQDLLKLYQQLMAIVPA